MAVPKRRSSRSRRDKRRTHQKEKVTIPSLQACPECGEPKRSHAACPGCGMYKGRLVIGGGEEL
ncbi:MAG: 50S ribosomal protein L32 [Desulforegulaceae bacterium]|nr:50S ribosomal protein L32 [Desulforegulaceae bacterium]